MKKLMVLFVMVVMVVCLTSCEKDYYNRYYPYCYGCHCGDYYNDLCTCDCHWNDPYNKHTQGRWAREGKTRSTSAVDSTSTVITSDSINTVSVEHP